MRTMIVEEHFQMNYITGKWNCIKKRRNADRSMLSSLADVAVAATTQAAALVEGNASQTPSNTSNQENEITPLETETNASDVVEDHYSCFAYYGLEVVVVAL